MYGHIGIKKNGTACFAHMNDEGYLSKYLSISFVNSNI